MSGIKLSVYELPYPDNQFDAFFGHALLEHMHDPLAVLQQAHRVLKPGGVIGIRSPDLAATLIAPADATLDNAFDIWVRYRLYCGGTPLVGRNFRALLREAGFTKTIGMASSESWGTSDLTQALMPVLTDEFVGREITETAIQQGWADQEQMDSAASAPSVWSEHPDAFFSVVWCEGVAWKDETS